jgi:hypothetical protein
LNPQSAFRNPQSGDPLNLIRLTPSKGEKQLFVTVPSLIEVERFFSFGLLYAEGNFSPAAGDSSE